MSRLPRLETTTRLVGVPSLNSAGLGDERRDLLQLDGRVVVDHLVVPEVQVALALVEVDAAHLFRRQLGGVAALEDPRDGSGGHEVHPPVLGEGDVCREPPASFQRGLQRGQRAGRRLALRDAVGGEDVPLGQRRGLRGGGGEREEKGEREAGGTVHGDYLQRV